jgi:hypothetical protein
MASSVKVSEITRHPKRDRENTCEMLLTLIPTSQGIAVYSKGSPEKHG